MSTDEKVRVYLIETSTPETGRKERWKDMTGTLLHPPALGESFFLHYADAEGVERLFQSSEVREIFLTVKTRNSTYLIAKAKP